MRVSPLWLLLWLLTSPWALAEGEEAPSLALLEYLGEWQDESGNEIDPQVLALLVLQAAADGGESDEQE